MGFQYRDYDIVYSFRGRFHGFGLRGVKFSVMYSSVGLFIAVFLFLQLAAGWLGFHRNPDSLLDEAVIAGATVFLVNKRRSPDKPLGALVATLGDELKGPRTAKAGLVVRVGAVGPVEPRVAPPVRRTRTRG